MKIIEIPATLRVFVEDGTTDDQIEKLTESLVSHTCGTVEEAALDDELKRYLDSSGGDSNLVIGSDLWVAEFSGMPTVHS
jgi:hypothetical protein